MITPTQSVGMIKCVLAATFGRLRKNRSEDHGSGQRL